MLRTSWFGPAAFAVLLLIPIEGAAAAPMTERGVLEFDAAIAVTPEVHAPPMAVAPVGEERPIIADTELGDQRGGQSLVIASQSMQAITAGNTIFGDSNAGAVNVSDNALSNFNGLGNIMINTGSQVSLQSGMNITINVHP